MTEPRTVRSPLWLRLLGGTGVVLIAAGLLYAVSIALLRFRDIGV
jgi:hypothetical protein